MNGLVNNACLNEKAGFSGCCFHTLRIFFSKCTQFVCNMPRSTLKDKEILAMLYLDKKIFQEDNSLFDCLQKLFRK